MYSNLLAALVSNAKIKAATIGYNHAHGVHTTISSVAKKDNKADCFSNATNRSYIENLYKKWQLSPSLVDPSWHSFFQKAKLQKHESFTNYVTELHKKWQQNPKKIESYWQAFFDTCDGQLKEITSKDSRDTEKTDSGRVQSMDEYVESAAQALTEENWPSHRSKDLVEEAVNAKPKDRIVEKKSSEHKTSTKKEAGSETPANEAGKTTPNSDKPPIEKKNEVPQQVIDETTINEFLKRAWQLSKPKQYKNKNDNDDKHQKNITSFYAPKRLNHDQSEGDINLGAAQKFRQDTADKSASSTEDSNKEEETDNEIKNEILSESESEETDQIAEENSEPPKTSKNTLEHEVTDESADFEKNETESDTEKTSTENGDNLNTSLEDDVTNVESETEADLQNNRLLGEDHTVLRGGTKSRQTKEPRWTPMQTDQYHPGDHAHADFTNSINHYENSQNDVGNSRPMLGFSSAIQPNLSKTGITKKVFTSQFHDLIRNLQHNLNLASSPLNGSYKQTTAVGKISIANYDNTLIPNEGHIIKDVSGLEPLLALKKMNELKKKCDDIDRSIMKMSRSCDSFKADTEKLEKFLYDLVHGIQPEDGEVEDEPKNAKVRKNKKKRNECEIEQIPPKANNCNEIYDESKVEGDWNLPESKNDSTTTIVPTPEQKQPTPKSTISTSGRKNAEQVSTKRIANALNAIYLRFASVKLKKEGADTMKSEEKPKSKPIVDMESQTVSNSLWLQSSPKLCGGSVPKKKKQLKPIKFKELPEKDLAKLFKKY